MSWEKGSLSRQVIGGVESSMGQPLTFYITSVSKYLKSFEIKKRVDIDEMKNLTYRTGDCFGLS